MADELETLLLEGWRFGQYGPGLDPAVFAMFGGGSPWSEASTQENIDALYNASQGTPPPDPPPKSADTPSQEPSNDVEEAPPVVGFVPPPLPAPIRPVPIVPPVVSPTVGAGSGLLASILSAAAPVVALLFPQPTAPRELDEAPTPDPLPEVKVEGVRKPPPPVTLRPDDFLEPPNWNDLLDWRQPFGWWLGGVFPDPRDSPSERPGSPSPRTPGSRPTPAPVGDQLDEVTVTGRRPKPSPLDSVAPDFYRPALPGPGGFPFDLPFDQPIPEPQPQPNPRAKPAPKVVTAPDLFSSPFARPFAPTLDPFLDPFLNPTLDPRAEPAPDTRTRPVPAPRTPTASPPNPFAPFSPTLPTIDDLPDPLEQPDPVRADPCNCKAVKVEKQPKKRKQRTRCYGGTYIENRTTTKKSPKRWVDCETGETIGGGD